MRLINCATLCLEQFNDHNVPPYAILSHCWGSEDEEVYYTDMVSGSRPQDSRADACSITRWMKVFMASWIAKDVYGLRYIWVDTCCIDKSSSAELTEAINSMWKWYWYSEVCIAYLPDVDGILQDLHSIGSRWFTRGWTLQELIAPAKVDFLDKNWRKMGDRATLSLLWSDDVCKVDRRVLMDGGRERLKEFSVATRLSWASNRRTTRSEDRAYSLLGIFGVNMSTLYGEGYERAFLRLQAKIFKETADQSILAWQLPSPPSRERNQDVRELTHPWECEIYGEANTLCQNSIPNISATIAYVDAVRPWRLNNDLNYRTWTTTTKPLDTTYLFAPSLECFGSSWHSNLFRSHSSFTFPHVFDPPDKAWSFCVPAPSRRYGPRTQIVMSRITSWFVDDSRYSKNDAEVEYALYLAILPAHIVDKRAESFEDQPSDVLTDDWGKPSPSHYVAIHLLEASFDPGNFRRVTPTDVYVVDMTPIGSLKDNVYYSKGWTEKQNVRDNVLRIDPRQEAVELKKLDSLETIIKPKVRDVFLSRPLEGDFTIGSLSIKKVEPKKHSCIRMQWTFMETGELKRHGWEIISDTAGDKSGLQQATIPYLATPQNKHGGRLKEFIAWYRQPTSQDLFDRDAHRSTIRVLLKDTITNECFGVILSTHSIKFPKTRDRYKIIRPRVDDENLRETMNPLGWQMQSASIQIVSAREYHSLVSQDQTATSTESDAGEQKETVIEVCCCALGDPQRQSEGDSSTTYRQLEVTSSDLAGTSTSPSPEKPDISEGLHASVCQHCNRSATSPGLDACDRLLVVSLPSGRNVTLGFIEPKRRVIDDIRLGPMLIFKIVVGRPEDWLEEVEKDVESGITGASLGEKLFEQVGKPSFSAEPRSRVSPEALKNFRRQGGRPGFASLWAQEAMNSAGV